ncbi:STAS domain-containing protein [Saccharothrix coeruleofusca]|uniref:Anti-sigma factor antagonist n=1 Tax=Saccharothrix coeruleofusca TaxID=33919 RepID=A0A918AI05_9PSEU|nr:STAS domain-containing protein [Saccharothrix coeruleofusca]MBP2333950.1 stage II sporulation protein AA (anti-sigma F factor antagonist) [Saccharothrix coeruleofusca]GGP44517.1 hypothetical protein GCM10010185_15300 [Saccharothrix coeruleofusca]
MHTETQRIGEDVVVLAAAGEIDIATAEDLRKPLIELAGRTPEGGTVVADLTGITFFSSPGIEALLVAHERLGQVGGTLHVVAAPVVRRALTAVGLDRALRLHDTLEAALSR